MKRLMPFVGALIVLTIAAPVAAQRSRSDRGSAQSRDRNDDDRGPKETEHVDRSIPIAGNGQLKLRNFSGKVRIVGTNGREIVMKATRRATRERLDHVKLDVKTSGNVVIIDANKKDAEWERSNHNNNVVETEFELQVPASVDLDIDAFASDITVEGMEGEQMVKTFSGEITLSDPRSGVEAETFSGDIRMTVARNAKGSVSFSTFSGSVDTALPIASTSWRRRNVDGTLPGGSGPRMKFHTFSGDLVIKQR